ncbi:hypothetical protein Tco_0973731 [Tanacetum coccineum]
MTWRTTERQWSADIDLITFQIRLVYLISKHLVTLLHLELQVNDIWIESFNNLICLPFEICLYKHSLVHFTAVPVHEKGMVQAGLGVAGLSSFGSGFHQLFSCQHLVGAHSRCLHRQIIVPILREWNLHSSEKL